MTLLLIIILMGIFSCSDAKTFEVFLALYDGIVTNPALSTSTGDLSGSMLEPVEEPILFHYDGTGLSCYN